MQAKGYGSVVSFDGQNIVIDRNKLLTAQYGFNQTIIPVTSVVAVNASKATILTNGLFCLSVMTANGPTELITSAAESRKSPYCAIFTKGHAQEFQQLVDEVNAAKPVQAMPILEDQSGDTVYARQMKKSTEEKQERLARQQVEGRLVEMFSGSDGTRFALFEHAIRCGSESHSLDGVSASVLDGSALESRVTATRLLLLGVFAFAFKKKKGGEKYVLIEGPDFAWMAEADRKHIRDAVKFATAVQNQVLKQQH